MLYGLAMSKRKQLTDNVVVVNTGHGKFYRLADGRLIPVPPRGGNVRRRDIRDAVRSVVSDKKQAKVG